MTDQTFYTKPIYFTILFPAINQRTHIKQNAYFTSNTTDEEKKSKHFRQKRQSAWTPLSQTNEIFSNFPHLRAHFSFSHRKLNQNGRTDVYIEPHDSWHIYDAYAVTIQHPTIINVL